MTLVKQTQEITPQTMVPKSKYRYGARNPSDTGAVDKLLLSAAGKLMDMATLCQRAIDRKWTDDK